MEDMNAPENLEKIIQFLEAANSGKQIKYKWNNETDWFNAKVTDFQFEDFLGTRGRKCKAVEFKEKVPKLTDSDYYLITKALNWLLDHNLISTATNDYGKQTRDILDKMRDRNIQDEKGKYTEMIKVLKQMKKGKRFEHHEWNNRWDPISLNWNIYPLNEAIKNGEVREIIKGNKNER
jgi:hypothetical protein